MTQDEIYMNIALCEAKKAFESNEVPIGACIVCGDKVLAKAHNMRETKKMATAHAEILAIDKACKKMADWRLNDCELFVTLEPCVMCFGAVLNSRIKRVVFGAYDKDGGSAKYIDEKIMTSHNHKPIVAGGVCEKECSQLLSTYFKSKRK